MEKVNRVQCTSGGGMVEDDPGGTGHICVGGIHDGKSVTDVIVTHVPKKLATLAKKAPKKKK